MTAKLPLELSVTELATVKTILVRHVPDAEVWVFGSRATGQSKKYFDLDLCIKANHPLGLDVMSALA
jgi:DNA polymerase sigma|uniref:nucleotidyltransferase domain-containing protein n=1 Tax=Orrella sp. TaxID=1921583 RepID=UPI004047DF31